MEFFLLKPFEGGCRLKLVNRDPDLLICRVTREGEPPDFTLHPAPLLSNRFKELLEQYLPSMEFRPCLLEGKDSPDFWTFHPRELSPEQAQYQPDGTVRAVNYRGLLPIFMVPNYKKVSFVVNLALAESLLRRGFVNLGLGRIETLEYAPEHKSEGGEAE